MIQAAVVLPAAEAGQVQVGDFTVNRMGFGAMRVTGPGSWGEPENLDVSKQVIKRAVELGVNFIDTADAYGPNVSEALVRQTLAPYPSGLIIATKGGQVRPSQHEWVPAGSPEQLREACKGSLKRLGLRQIPLYQLHRVDPAIPLEDSLATLLQLQEEGSIKHIGLSNVTLDQLKAARQMAPIASVQNHYNLMHRRDSEAILTYCEEQGIVFIPYFPMGGNMAHLELPAVQQIAQKYDVSLRQVALAWLLARSPATLPIPGTASIEHLEENIAAARLRLTPHDMQVLDKVSD